MISAERAARIRGVLDAFVDDRPVEARIARDPIEFPRRFRGSPRDVEAAGLIAAALAYGRADLFKPKVELILAGLGPRPAEGIEALTMPKARKLLDGFVYRFNLPADVGVLLFGIRAALRRVGSLEALFLEGQPTTSLHGALAHFTHTLREAAPRQALRKALGPERGLGHLLPDPLGNGAAKRLNLYLRWMVRGPDSVDLGVWKQVPASALLMPIDTHVHRMATLLGLTSRKDLSWKTAEEVTAGLRLLNAEDPVRYDFALCHYGMSGACPATPVRENCLGCPLKSWCRVGRRLKERA